MTQSDNSQPSLRDLTRVDYTHDSTHTNPSGGPLNIPPYIPPPPSRDYSSPHRPHKWIKTLITLLIILGGGGYAVYAFILSPDRVIPKGASVIDATKELQAKLSLTIERNNGQSPMTSVIVFNNVDKFLSNAPKYETTYDLMIGSSTLAAESIVNDNLLYIKISKIPEEYSIYLKTDMKANVDQWYSLNKDSLQTLGQSWPIQDSLSDLYQRLSQAGNITYQRLLGVSLVSWRPVARYSMTIDRIPGASFEPIMITVDLISGSIMDIEANLLTAEPARKIRAVLSYDRTTPIHVVIVPTDAVPLNIDVAKIINFPMFQL